MNRVVSYDDKAEAMFEAAMEDVKDQVDKAWQHAENLAMLIGEVKSDELRDKLDEELSNIMIILEKI